MNGLATLEKATTIAGAVTSAATFRNAVAGAAKTHVDAVTGATETLTTTVQTATKELAEDRWDAWKTAAKALVNLDVESAIEQAESLADAIGELAGENPVNRYDQTASGEWTVSSQDHPFWTALAAKADESAAYITSTKTAERDYYGRGWNVWGQWDERTNANVADQLHEIMRLYFPELREKVARNWGEMGWDMFAGGTKTVVGTIGGIVSGAIAFFDPEPISKTGAGMASAKGTLIDLEAQLRHIEDIMAVSGLSGVTLVEGRPYWMEPGYGRVDGITEDLTLLGLDVISFGTIAANRHFWTAVAKRSASALSGIGQRVFYRTALSEAQRVALRQWAKALADDSGEAAVHLLDEIIEKFCFAGETLVQTRTGMIRIDEVEPGMEVACLDFNKGGWSLGVVQKRHQSQYSGRMVRIDTGNEQIEVTFGHPFWVVDGTELQTRPRPGQLAADENQGCGVPGRWVNSEWLSSGDEFLTSTGSTCRVITVEQYESQNIPVYNLTVADQHTFAVGASGILVHNAGWCDVLNKMQRGADALKALASREGFRSAAIHAHHIVMKTVERGYHWVAGKTLAEAALHGRRAERAWYVLNSQELLKSYGVGLLDNLGDAMARAAAGKEKLHNLAWAINGNVLRKNGERWYKYSIHSTEYARAVYQGLNEIVERMTREGRTKDEIASAIKSKLDEWRQVLEEGGHFWY